MQIPSTNLVWVADVRALSIDRNPGVGNRREGEYTCWSLFLGMSIRVVTRCFSVPLRPKVQRQTICFGSQSEKYLLWDTHTSWSKRVWSFLLLFPFLSWYVPYIFYGAHFCNTCLFLNIPKYFRCCRL